MDSFFYGLDMKVLEENSVPYSLTTGISTSNGLCILPNGAIRQYTDYALHGYIAMHTCPELRDTLSQQGVDLDCERVCTKLYDVLYMSVPLLSISKSGVRGYVCVKTDNLNVFTKRQLESLVEYLAMNKLNGVITETSSISPMSSHIEDTEIMKIATKKQLNRYGY